jgi:hypothetical protein
MFVRSPTNERTMNINLFRIFLSSLVCTQRCSSLWTGIFDIDPAWLFNLTVMGLFKHFYYKTAAFSPSSPYYVIQQIVVPSPKIIRKTLNPLLYYSVILRIAYFL